MNVGFSSANDEKIAFAERKGTVKIRLTLIRLFEQKFQHGRLHWPESCKCTEHRGAE